MLMTDTTPSLDTSKATLLSCHAPQRQHIVKGSDRLMGGVTLQVECEDESRASLSNKPPIIDDLAQENLLAVKQSGFVQLIQSEEFEKGDFESSSIPTPISTPTDSSTIPTIEFPTCEEDVACGIRGDEVAVLDDGGSKDASM